MAIIVSIYISDDDLAEVLETAKRLGLKPANILRDIITENKEEIIKYIHSKITISSNHISEAQTKLEQIIKLMEKLKDEYYNDYVVYREKIESHGEYKRDKALNWIEDKAVKLGMKSNALLAEFEERYEKKKKRKK